MYTLYNVKARDYGDAVTISASLTDCGVNRKTTRRL